MKKSKLTLRERWHELWNRQQVTRAGLGYTLAILLVAIAAFISANNLLFLILSSLLATLLVSSFVSRMGLAGLELDLLLPEHVSARTRTHAAVRVTNLKRWMPSFSIRLNGAKGSGVPRAIYVPVLAGRSSVEEPVEVTFAQRGSQKERVFQFSTRFPFGFTERREMVTLRHEVVVYPCLEPRPEIEQALDALSGELAATQQGRGQEFYRIRPYEALESARHLDWKATAHTGDMQVREFARDEDQQVLLYLDLNAPALLDAWFEEAVEGAAYLAWELARRGVPLRFQTQALDVTLGENGDVHTILKYLAFVARDEEAKTAAPDNPHSFQLVFTSNPQRMADLGWGLGGGAQMLCPPAAVR